MQVSGDMIANKVQAALAGSAIVKVMAGSWGVSSPKRTAQTKLNSPATASRFFPRVTNDCLLPLANVLYLQPETTKGLLFVWLCGPGRDACSAIRGAPAAAVTEKKGQQKLKNKKMVQYRSKERKENEKPTALNVRTHRVAFTAY